jgi:hypothetical protein
MDELAVAPLEAMSTAAVAAVAVTENKPDDSLGESSRSMSPGGLVGSSGL